MSKTKKPAGEKKPEYPKTITVPGITGITAKIYRTVATKGEKTYTSYVVGYSLLGKRKLESFADLNKAERAAEDAIRKIAGGQQQVLELSNTDLHVYLRAKEALAKAGLNMPLDAACIELAETRGILNGSGTPVEAARFFVKNHAKELPRIDLSKAVEKCLEQARADGKSKARIHQLESYLNAFAADNNCEVSTLTPGGISRYLTAMTASERTKKNARDVLGFFGRWLVLHGYLGRGSDLVEGVQRYSMKSGEIHIFTPAEVSRLIENASNRLLPYIAIGAFAGLRGAEIQRLDWSEIQDGFIEVTAEKAKTNVRRLVPVKPNLAAWLKDYHKKSGPVCPFKNVVNQLMKLVAKINKALPKRTPDKEKMHWKKNALRHSYISYRVAECADAARVSEESGNSVAIIRSNYLKRVKPEQAAEWFNILPADSAQGKVANIAA